MDSGNTAPPGRNYHPTSTARQKMVANLRTGDGHREVLWQHLACLVENTPMCDRGILARAVAESESTWERWAPLRNPASGVISPLLCNERRTQWDWGGSERSSKRGCEGNTQSARDPVCWWHGCHRRISRALRRGGTARNQTVSGSEGTKSETIQNANSQHGRRVWLLGFNLRRQATSSSIEQDRKSANNYSLKK